MTVLQDPRVLVVENDEMRRCAAADAAGACRRDRGRVGGERVDEALRLLEDSAPDVALLDYRLARNETSEPVAAALSASAVCRSCWLATGMLAEQLPASMLAGVLLVKPYLSVDLSQALVRAVGHSRVKA